MEQEIIDIINRIAAAGSTGGWLAALGVLITLSVRLYALGPVQSLLARVLPRKWLWGSLNNTGRLITVFAATGIGTVVLAVVGGMSWGVAISSGLVAGLASIGIDKGSKAVGGIVYKSMPTTLIGKAGSIVIPVPKRFMAPVIKTDRGE